MIVQRFTGLNVWDQLAVDIVVNGNLPDISSGAAIVFPDSSDSYVFQGENRIQSDGNGAIDVDGRPIPFVINQVVCLANNLVFQIQFLKWFFTSQLSLSHSNKRLILRRSESNPVNR